MFTALDEAQTVVGEGALPSRGAMPTVFTVTDRVGFLQSRWRIVTGGHRALPYAIIEWDQRRTKAATDRRYAAVASSGRLDVPGRRQ